MDTSTLGQVKPGIEPPTFWFVDNLQEPLTHCRPDIWTRIHVFLCFFNHADFTGQITKIINVSIKEGKFPKDWKSATIVLVHKSGDLTWASNYRPISILLVISKIAWKCVC